MWRGRWPGVTGLGLGAASKNRKAFDNPPFLCDITPDGHFSAAAAANPVPFHGARARPPSHTMTTQPPARPGSWRQSRLGLAVFFFLSLLALNTVLRGVLAGVFRPPGTGAAELAQAFLIGLHLDVYTSLLMTLPLLAWLLVADPAPPGRAWRRFLLLGGLFVFWTGQVFVAAAEYYFFEEFKSRYNTVAVDYLIYPTEVFINIWREYPVPAIVGGCALLAAGWAFGARRLFPGVWTAPAPRLARAIPLAAALLLAAALTPTVSFTRSHFSSERVLNEIANSSLVSFVAAAWTRQLDYAVFYKTLPPDQARARARRLLQEPGAVFHSAPGSVRRTIAGDASRPKLNVVILLEESLGSEFFGCLGRPGPTLTPAIDRLALAEGLLFTNIYATGNRTVRGFEGVLSSFPPLPGDSIVKRPLSQNVETIARVLKRDGYQTLFLYGGRGLFDGMRAFAVNNGYDRFVEQKDFQNPSFSTIWGVADGDLLQRSVVELRALAASGKPFHATILSVSNHKPYTYPPGLIPEDPAARSREHAVKYCDATIGQFFEAVRREPFHSNTVYVVIADHGARVFGSQSVPIRSYEIPFVVLGPAVVRQPARIGALGCSMDVAPTVLGLIGRPYESLFFGRDLLKPGSGPGRALLNHNRSIGIYTPGRLAILGLRQTEEFYTGDAKTGQLLPARAPAPADLELQADAIALYQTADELYIHRQFRLDP